MGRSIGCEMNKFDDMMALLAASNANFSQVVAVDSQCGLFHRAWCVAELVQASQMQLVQHVKNSFQGRVARTCRKFAGLACREYESLAA